VKAPEGVAQSRRTRTVCATSPVSSLAARLLQTHRGCMLHLVAHHAAHRVIALLLSSCRAPVPHLPGGVTPLDAAHTCQIMGRMACARMKHGVLQEKA